MRNEGRREKRRGGRFSKDGRSILSNVFSSRASFIELLLNNLYIREREEKKDFRETNKGINEIEK